MCALPSAIADRAFDLYCAQLCAAIYDPAPAAAAQFDFIDAGADDGVYWGRKRFDGLTLIALRGSRTPGDWIRDLLAMPDPFYHHGQLGPVHRGFALGTEQACGEILRASEGTEVVLIGHSFGAAHADILAGLMCVSGRSPKRRVCFGEPQPGFARLAEVLKAVPGASYRNGHAVAHEHDLVTDVPFTLPPFAEFVHPTPLVDVYAAPAPDDQWGAFRYHHMDLYVKALAA